MERNRSDDHRRSVARRPSGAAVMRPAVTDALTRALFSEWAAVGYGTLSLERVARRAGVGKAALYRRWPSKASMVADGLSRVGLAITDVDNQGSLEGDIGALLFALRRVLRHPLVRRILPDLHAEIGRSPDLRAAIRPFQAERRARATEVINRAIVRGELSSKVDPELANDLLGAPLYWRLIVIGGVVDRSYIHRLATALTAALQGSVASSDSLDGDGREANMLSRSVSAAKPIASTP